MAALCPCAGSGVKALAERLPVLDTDVVTWMDLKDPRAMATRIEELYEADFYVWTQRQAEALRRLAETRPNVELDFPHLIEEVEDLGTSQRDAVRRQVRRVIEDCLKLEYSRAVDPRGGWYARGHFFRRFSRRIAASIESWVSNHTSRFTPYLSVRPGTMPSRCSATRRTKSLVTPT
jgi:hypothetical protein